MTIVPAFWKRAVVWTAIGVSSVVGPATGTGFRHGSWYLVPAFSPVLLARPIPHLDRN